jgi:hypothetical protein
MRLLIGAVLVAVLSALLLALGAPLALAGAGAGGGGAGQPVLPSSGPAGPAVADIPPAMLALYVSAAQRCPGLPWQVLAAIGKVETDHGRGAMVSPAGAEGPMQFMPATWAEYGVDGDGDGVASIWDAADAVPAAADLLCANGGGNPATLASAILQYNHADWYVQLVLAWAAKYAAAATPD